MGDATYQNCQLELKPASETPRVEQQNEELVQDMQGQDQYIGPASSYFFQMKLRSLLGLQRQERRCQMFLFGRNPTGETLRPFDSKTLTESEVRAVARPSETDLSDSAIVPYPAPLLDRSVIDGLIRAYFDYVNIDFPVLHEASFLETYDRWRYSPGSVDPAWVSALLCVLLLSRRINPLGTTETQQQRWWTLLEAGLPNTIFINNMLSVQTLMLTALHLHNTNHRDACWTLTGAAARIGMAIGLHRDEIICDGPRLAKELRKSLWWTLYSFEQIQVSSHDRPSAIDGSMCSTTSPHERILGMGSSNWPPDYTLWSTRLTTLLGLVCRALPTATNEPALTGLLSPAAGLLRDLTRWQDSLPKHLSLSVFSTLPDGFKRPVLLLHIQYHYTVCLLTRYALLQQLAALSQGSVGGPNEGDIDATAKICGESGRKSCELLLQMDLVGKFNPVTWWDVYYVYSSTLVLTLSILCDHARPQREESATNRSLSLLHDCADMLIRHCANPMVPDTMIRWTGAIRDIDLLVNERLDPSQQAPYSHGSDSMPGTGPSNTLVPLGSTMKAMNPPFPSMGGRLDPSTEHSVPQMGPPMREMHHPFPSCMGMGGLEPITEPNISPMGTAMVFASDSHNNPVLAMPPLADDNGLFSWDSIGSMLLGTDVLNHPMNCNL
ncbi:hypothetical protein ASPCADRAFT_207142 [Aspergillus carbonarius ITEM 5010]|uniref:Xylanolytic transcriptional activator regulatory domain-containing protein n=1 Tax=Aspergillus carbonarius (strain ITEM 5010) TaxID=602072 RepID=A0A1R3RMS3_ASPC5|nr:hypothetical protein ASPCADRAFT_207142 [Aspergillus carbonarius ITEM 5010]